MRVSLEDFYEKFGFIVFAGAASQHWLIMKNGEHAIGFFHGMFEKNMLTFNPGWDSNAGKLGSFTDVRDLQRQLKAGGVQLVSEADEATTGPASLVAIDSDGNPILDGVAAALPPPPAGRRTFSASRPHWPWSPGRTYHIHMTKALQKAFDPASRLPLRDQDELAAAILHELAAEQRWEAALAESGPALERLADEVVREQ